MSLPGPGAEADLTLVWNKEEVTLELLDAGGRITKYLTDEELRALVVGASMALKMRRLMEDGEYD